MKQFLTKRTVIAAVIWLLIAALSLGVLAPHFSDPETYSHTIAKLHEKQQDIMDVTAFATVTSVALAAVPDDSTTPVANKIMDLAGYLVLVLCAIFIEKYMLTLAGYICFTYLLPCICLLELINLFADRRMITAVIRRIFALGLVILFVVPASVHLSDVIENTMDLSLAMPFEELSNADNDGAEIAQAAADAAELAEDGAVIEGESGNIFKRSFDFVKSGISHVEEAVTEAYNYTADAVAGLESKAQNLFWDMVEKVVILIIIDLAFPILTLMLLMWCVNLVLGTQLSLPEPAKLRTKHRAKTGDGETGDPI